MFINNKTMKKENFDCLINVCERIISVANENNNGQLMGVQLICLGDNIKEFLDNPIIKCSGLLNQSQSTINKFN